MGTRMVPSYANIFMQNLENKLLATAPKQPDVWWRFIDDIFALWRHREETLKMLLEHLNQAHPTIKFIYSQVVKRDNFLDVTVKLEHGTLATDLHVKPTDTHQYLASNSCHPDTSKKPSLAVKPFG